MSPDELLRMCTLEELDRQRELRALKDEVQDLEGSAR
jgi:hypothetical protein